MRIGLSYDLKEAIGLEGHGSDDALEEYDSPGTVKIIAATLEANGDSVVMLGGGKEFVCSVLHRKVDFVFNIAEGRGNYRSREAQVPSVLEMMDIPYSGSDPQCLAICLDKPLTKQLVAAAGVCTPKWCVVAGHEELRQRCKCAFHFPVIVKPAYEGSSKGIRAHSVAGNWQQMSEIVEKSLKHYRQPVMVEEFITGDEVTVGVVGNFPPKVLGIMRVIPRDRNGPFVYSLEVKRDYLNLVDYECPARLHGAVMETIEAHSINAYKALGCRDFARLDFRVTPEGEAYFIEINPLPGLGTYSDLVIMATELGWTHEQLIRTVLDAAIERYPQCIPE